MESGVILDLVYQALRMAALLAGPILMALLVVGLVIGILQVTNTWDYLMNHLRDLISGFIPVI